MTLGPAAQWIVFSVFALISVAGALGMATTMSMFRSGIFLMASFMGVAGLFILLLADLLALLQVMMYIGGMLVMILFMVMFSHDPGGAMMAEMEMSPIERLFSLGIPPMKMEEDQQEDQDEDPSSHSGQGDGGQESGAHDGHSADDGARQTEEHEGSENSGQDSHKAQGHEGMQMDMQSMSMTTPLKRPAAVLAACSALLLTLMLLLNAEWPVTQAQPDPRSAHQVGGMLMSKYMMAFEGAGLLILIGIYGAVLLSRPGSHPDDSGRLGRAAIDDKPVPIAEPPLDPLLPREAYPDEEVGAGHGESH